MSEHNKTLESIIDDIGDDMDEFFNALPLSSRNKNSAQKFIINVGRAEISTKNSIEAENFAEKLSEEIYPTIVFLYVEKERSGRQFIAAYQDGIQVDDEEE